MIAKRPMKKVREIHRNKDGSRTLRPGGGKAKGSAFEREVCTLLSLWMTANDRKDLFWRSAMSGGRATVAKKKGETLASVSGDICATDPLGSPLIDRYFIECKHYKDLQWDRFILLNSGTLAKFWIKATEEATKHHKRPMVIAKQNGMPAMVILPMLSLSMISPDIELRWLDIGIIAMDRLLQSKPELLINRRRAE